MKNMKGTTIMYIQLYKAINEYVEESCDITQCIINVIRQNLKYYEIDVYKGDGSPTDEIEYYIDELSKKHLDIKDIFKTPYWKYNRFISYNAAERLRIEEVMNNIKIENEVKKFLNWYKVKCAGIVEYFDYILINKNEISSTIQQYSTDYTPELRIEIQDFGYNFYNPIIAWENDGTLFIMDWVNLKSSIIREDWIDPCDIQDFFEQFSIPTLEDYLAKEYDVHKIVRKELQKEVEKFYEEYKDDIKMEDDIAFSISNNMMLVDAIWNDAPFFCNSLIESLVVKLYNKEIKL